MALTLIKEDGTGKMDANTYASAADGDAYHEAHLYATAWTGATAGKKDAALVMATRLLDSEWQFNGAKTSATQALQWPRADCPDPDSAGEAVASTLVPRPVLSATCELARELLVQDRTAAVPGEGLVATWTDSGGTKYSKTDRRPVLSYVVQALLSKYGASIRRGSAVVRLVRA